VWLGIYQGKIPDGVGTRNAEMEGGKKRSLLALLHGSVVPKTKNRKKGPTTLHSQGKEEGEFWMIQIISPYLPTFVVRVRGTPQVERPKDTT